MNAYDRLLLPENLNYAWRKAKTLYRMADGYVDHGEIAEFELDLERRLKRIQTYFENGHYRLSKLRPLPRPKALTDEKPINRQYFHVAIDDQVAWIAVANALGPELDKLMPPWSYSYRIYRPAWYEEDEDRRSQLEIGPYRHESGHLYRRFQNSWPLFRRHVALTAKVMVRDTPFAEEDLDEFDQLAMASAHRDKLPYLQADFWTRPAKKVIDTDLYHASIDLKHFYPRIRLTAVIRGLGMTNVTDEASDPMRTVLADMLRFRLDKADMTVATLEDVEPDYGNEHVHGIPTGLFVSGFLANVAMLSIDKDVARRINELRSIAHFRFVDDHTIIAYDFDELCDWITYYKQLLVQHDIGVEVNNDKYDPPSLSIWMNDREEMALSDTSHSMGETEKRKAHKEAAIRDTKLDGANPTRLLTKTLGQVSAIAATTPDILDDEDLEERLRLLEWLLLADIPEREIRPDTRAAFAAGQIATLAPLLIREADHLIDATRALASLKGRMLRAVRTTDQDSDTLASDHQLQKTSEHVNELLSVQSRERRRRLEHCFDLLLQAFREYPAKARLFYRLHQYCQVTGHKGLSSIAQWIKEMRKRGHCVWADYYAGLSLQLLAVGVLVAARSLNMVNALRSDKEAAVRYLNDVGALDTDAVLIPRGREAWFHRAARRSLGVALVSVSNLVREDVGDVRLAERLNVVATKCIRVRFAADELEWVAETGRLPGVWANRIENDLSNDEQPSSVWKLFAACFTYSNVIDSLAARRYPELLSDDGWHYFLESARTLNETDSGWLREVMYDHPRRITDARVSKRKAFTRASRSCDPPGNGWMTLSKWTECVSTQCSSFDPRRSEWTALEIVRQIVFPIVNTLTVTETRLDSLHPNNVLLVDSWKTDFPVDQRRAGVSWKEWIAHVRKAKEGASAIRLRNPATSVKDYRYFSTTHTGRTLDGWERRLLSVGRLLLGLLRFDHSSPRLWNIRRNEEVVALPRAQLFRSLAISTPTLVLVEGCLSGRSAETRAIHRIADLFGWKDGIDINDVTFDPPMLLGADELLKAIESAQQVLEDNQLAVAMNQPRQLIPFRLKDFATGPDDGESDGAHDQ